MAFYILYLLKNEETTQRKTLLVVDHVEQLRPNQLSDNKISPWDPSGKQPPDYNVHIST